MPELTAVDVELYTHGRLLANDVEVTRALNRALNAARRYCEWHVTPIIPNDVVTLDGPGDRVLVIPTKGLVTLHSVIEDGTSLDVSTIKASANNKWSRGVVRLRKQWPQRWCGGYSSIVINMTHGLPEAEAEDFRIAVLDAVDRFSSLATGGLKSLSVDDVSQTWFDRPEEAFNVRLLDPFRLKVPG